MAYSGSDKAVIPAVIRKDTIETTGTGDCFGACILHKVLEKGMREYEVIELKNMPKFTNTVASVVITRRGALRVMTKKEEIYG